MFLHGIKGKRGFTLVEVIVAMALLGMVISIAYSITGVSRKALNNSNDQFDIQNDIRIASSYVSNEIRFATELKIITYSDVTAGMNAHTAGYSYFYIHDGALYQAKYIDSSTYEEHAYGNTISDAIEKSFFQAAGTDTLEIKLTAEQDDESYD
ncbi:MAG: PilW family protein, partial [Oscillospiraceae bacterium]